jgi:hypothetical protein
MYTPDLYNQHSVNFVSAPMVIVIFLRPIIFGMSLGYFFVRGGVGVGHSVDEICGEERHNTCGVLRNRVQRCTREGASTAGLQEEPWEEGSVKDVSVVRINLPLALIGIGAK